MTTTHIYVGNGGGAMVEIDDRRDAADEAEVPPWDVVCLAVGCGWEAHASDGTWHAALADAYEDALVHLSRVHPAEGSA